MKVCPKCRECFDDENTYCNLCGVKLSVDQQNKTPQSDSYQQTQKSSMSYTVSSSPYQNSAWITALKSLYKIAFATIIIIGVSISMRFFSDDEVVTGFLVIVGATLLAVITVGFEIVFLDLASDIRDIAKYIHQINSMMIEDKNKKR